MIYLQWAKLIKNYNSRVKLVIVSHWYDDHIMNISQIIQVCEGAEFCCADALRSDEFKTFIMAFGESGIEQSGVEELYKIMLLLLNRKPRQNRKFAVTNRLLFNRSKDDSGLSLPVSIYALSPSDAARLLSIETVNVLFFRIPHHGSITGYNHDVWNSLLKEKPLACLTPFCAGRLYLPEKEGVEKIYSHTDQAFITSQFFKSKKIERDKAAERTIKEMGVKLETIFSSLGQIRLRFKPAINEMPKIELINGACELKEVHN